MKRRFTCAALALLFGALFLEANWSPAEVPILTRWGHTVTPENAWTEYPRPQLRRSEWKNLNGLWDYAITEHDAPTPAAAAEGHILIPYSIDSALSGVRRQMDADEDIWYWRKFEIPEHWQGQRILLHFEAVDWRTEVWVNRQLVGTHTGGYAPFSFDITETLIEDGPQALMVKAWDPQDTLFKPLGKQANDEEQYDRCSGIWGTVWLEPVSAAHIRRLRITPNASGVVQIETDLSGSTTGTSFRYKVLEKGESILQRTSETGALELKIREPELWSPETPFLYGLKVYLLQYGEVVDEVESYFGLRSVGLVDTPLGKQMALNGKAIFQMGPLDQNYWPGGGLTPPSDEAMIWECQYLKAIGCNMVRLHIKQNPRRWYYHCDRMGLLVWQDFITAIKGQRYENVSRNESDQWLSGQEALMDTLHNHPSIIKWIIFNEAWGQHDTERILNWTKKKDTSRILSIASGWDDLPGESEVRDLHDYTFYPAIPAFVTNPNRVVVFGECGGFAGAVPPHNWTGRSNQTGKPENILFGGFDPSVPRDDNRVHDILRATFNFGKPFETQYSQFVDSLVLLKNQGLGAAVYTQMTDMKLEENGWLTFDREVSKIDVNALKAIHDRLYQDPPNQKAFLQGDWKYRLGEHLADHWVKPGFDDTGWDSGNAPFGFNSILKTDTEWRGGNLRLRKTFTVDSIPDRLSLRVTTYLDGPNRVETVYTKIYLNGEFIQDDQTRQFIPEQRVAEIPLWPETLANLKQGENLIAVEVIPGFSFRSGKVAGEGPRNGLAFDIQLMEIEE